MWFRSLRSCKFSQGLGDVQIFPVLFFAGFSDLFPVSHSVLVFERVSVVLLSLGVNLTGVTFERKPDFLPLSHGGFVVVDVFVSFLLLSGSP